MGIQVSNVGLKFSYDSEFGEYRPDAYERLLLDSLQGDSALFLSNSEIRRIMEIHRPDHRRLAAVRSTNVHLPCRHPRPA